MITTHRSNLEARCTERGYTLDEVMPCVVSQDGDEWTIDTESEFYPRVSRLQESPTFPLSHGPGTELKKLLAGWPLYITASPDCSCNARAAEMDRHGVEWCETNIDTIVEWLREQATARGLPFLDVAGRLLVRRAIANARRNA
jgi:hypothetical protein